MLEIGEQYCVFCGSGGRMVSYDFDALFLAVRPVVVMPGLLVQ